MVVKWAMFFVSAVAHFVLVFLVGLLDVRVALLCASIVLLSINKHGSLTFTMFLLNIFFMGCCLVKYFSILFKKFLPFLVFRFAL